MIDKGAHENLFLFGVVFCKIENAREIHTGFPDTLCFLDYLSFSPTVNAACAAAKRATGTLNGEQLT